MTRAEVLVRVVGRVRRTRTADPDEGPVAGTDQGYWSVGTAMSTSAGRLATFVQRTNRWTGATTTGSVPAVGRMVDVADGVQVWAEESGDPRGTPLLLVMGANASSATWPPGLLDRLGAHHRVIRYDHRDTGRSTASDGEPSYAIRDLAGDTLAVLDAFGVDRAHVLGMSMGGVLVQLLLLDASERLLSATLLVTAAPGSGLAGQGEDGLPGVDTRLLALWQTMGEERDEAAKLGWRVEHWRLLNGDVLPFDADEFRAMEARAVAHAGTWRGSTAHATAAQDGLERGAELRAVTVPTLVVQGPEDPINPPPHGEHLAGLLGSATLVTVPGLGHALPGAAVPALVEAVTRHTRGVDDA